MYNDMMDTIGLVEKADPELAAAMDRELTRQRENIELIASENIVSPAVMAAMGSILTNKYAEGLPGKRYYGGCAYVDEVENIAIQRACKLFGAKYANVQPHSGAQANLAVYFALLDLGDTVMGMFFSSCSAVIRVMGPPPVRQTPIRDIITDSLYRCLLFLQRLESLNGKRILWYT